jgi:hypothetical protein
VYLSPLQGLSPNFDKPAPILDKGVP